MRLRRSIISAAAAIVIASMTGTAVAAPRTERVSFARGKSATVIKGAIKGYDYVDYVIGARGGQLMTVKLTTNRGSNYFNIMPRGSDTAYYIGSIDGNSFRGPVPATGDQVIRVYMFRSDARRGVTANYSLSISIVD